MQELSNAISEMDAGIADLAAGSAAFAEGLGLTADGAAGLASASSMINVGLEQLSQGLTVENMQTMAHGIEAVAAGVDSMGHVVGQYYSVTSSLANFYVPLSEAEQQALTGLQDGTDAQKSLISKYSAAYSEIYKIKVLLGTNVGNGMTLSDLMSLASAPESTQGSLKYMAAQLRVIAAGLDDGEQGAKSVSDAVAGLQALTYQYAQFDAGLAVFADGVAELNSNYALINEGTQQFAGGMSQLNQATIKIPATMRAEIEAMMADYDFPEFDPISFVDSRNDERMAAVQFVLTTDAIAVEEPDAVEEEEPARETIVDRFFALFQ